MCMHKIIKYYSNISDIIHIFEYIYMLKIFFIILLHLNINGNFKMYKIQKNIIYFK